MRAFSRITRGALAAAVAAVLAACGGPAGEELDEVAAPIDEASEPAWDEADVRELGEDGLPVLDPADIKPLQGVLEPQVFENVTVFEPKIAQHFGVGEKHLVIPYFGHEELRDVVPGHVLVANYLFMRRVVSVELRGDELWFETEQAGLQDAVKQGDFALKEVGYIDPETNQRVFFDERDNPFGDSYDDTRLFRLEPPVLGEGGAFGELDQGISTDGVTTTVPMQNQTLAENRYIKVDYKGDLSIKPNLSSSFSPSLEVSGRVECCEWFGITPYPYLRRFKLYGEGTASLTVGVEIKSKQSITGSMKIPIVSNTKDMITFDPAKALRPKITVPCTTASGAIGIVPIWVDFCPTLDAVFSISVFSEMTFSASVTATKTMGAGLLYDKDAGWSRLSRNPPLDVTPTVTGNFNLGMNASAGLELKVGAHVYSVAGPFIKYESKLKFQRACNPPALKQDLKWAQEMAAGVEVKAPQAIVDILPSVKKLKYEAKIWEPTPWKIWDGNGQCLPVVVTLAYQRVKANPNAPEGDRRRTRTLDLNLAVDVPAAAPNAAGTVSGDSGLRTMTGRTDAFPFVNMTSADFAGGTEIYEFSRVLTPGTYKIWAYDYENHAEATDAFGRARATITITNGARRYTYTAPGGTYNRWDAVTFTADAAGTITVSPQNSTRTVDEY